MTKLSQLTGSSHDIFTKDLYFESPNSVER